MSPTGNSARSPRPRRTLRPSRVRRGLKWCGLVFCLVVALAWVAGTRWHTLIRIGPRSIAWLATGGVVVRHTDTIPPGRGPKKRIQFGRASDYPHVDLPGAAADAGRFGGWACWCPWWLLLTAGVLPTAILWWRDRRAVVPRYCCHCGCSLTGNVSGVCPECGERVAPIDPGNPPQA